MILSKTKYLRFLNKYNREGKRTQDTKKYIRNEKRHPVARTTTECLFSKKEVKNKIERPDLRNTTASHKKKTRMSNSYPYLIVTSYQRKYKMSTQIYSFMNTYDCMTTNRVSKPIKPSSSTKNFQNLFIYQIETC